ncbi:MAG: phosphoglucomutase/phosphomannomutase family protein [Trichodesmium sp. MAG_R03]|nr:phosphoglucomutase/phosphomannomutase family protein [Trichodesmium sp. MAG_R03]
MAKPIKFGTDGWRGVIADDFTFERVALVASIAARVLDENYADSTNNSKTVIVGHDRRFMAEEFAQVAAKAVQNAGFDVLLTDTYAPTPAFSLAAFQKQALGAIVITASHNPGKYLGLKVKGTFGGSVGLEITQKIEDLLIVETEKNQVQGSKIESFNPWTSYCETLQKMVDIDQIKLAINEGRLKVFADVMHGAAAGGLQQILGVEIEELNGNRDPFFDGGAPEPLPRYLSKLFKTIKSYRAGNQGSLAIGLVFDGDSDRIAAVDGEGNFLSSQILIPILIEHLITSHGFSGEVVKTISGSDLFPKVAELYKRPIFETPVGYKYIADRMLSTQVLVGGEESGGIGYGTHIPERDALLSALYLLEAVVVSGQDLSVIYGKLQEKTGFNSIYDRIDLPLINMEVRSRLLEELTNNPVTEIAGQKVVDCLAIDGYKFRLADGRWLLIRFSGTEPVLRLYCEASDTQKVKQTLEWAKNWANSI